MSHVTDPPEVRAWYERRGVCRPPSYRRLFGTYDGPFFGWVVCELDDSGTAPRAPRAWPICRRCCAADCWRGTLCPGRASAARCALDGADQGSVATNALGCAFVYSLAPLRCSS